jgi:hypothetical protein
MLTSHAIARFPDDRYLLVDDTDEDASEILTVICDGDPRSNRGFDFDAYRNGGAV